MAHGEERRRLVLGAEIEVGVEGDFESADAVVAGVAVEVSAGAAVAGASAAAGHVLGSGFVWERAEERV